MDWTELLIGLGGGLLSLLAWLLGAAARYFGQKTKNEYANNAINRLDDALIAAVREVYQTYVSQIKKGRADGKLSSEEKAAAKDLAIDKAKSFLGKKGLKAVAKVLGLPVEGLDAMFNSRTESALNLVKKASQPAEVVAALPPFVESKQG